MSKDNRRVIGWCIYCKESIFEGDDYVVKEDKMYHEKECYNFVKEEYEEE